MISSGCKDYIYIYISVLININVFVNMMKWAWPGLNRQFVNIQTKG